MPSFRDLLKETKSQIVEISPDDAQGRLGSALFLDVREPDEYEQGAIPGALHIARGVLETQVENKVPNKTEPIVVYCAGGARSAFAAQSLQLLGYEDVTSMEGGFGKWKNEGRPWKIPL